MSKKKQTTKKRIKKRKYARTGKILTKTLYAYVEPANHKHANASGKKPKYGTTSGYINALIAADRGAKPAKGTKGQVLPKPRAVAKKKAKKAVSKKSSSPVKKKLKKIAGSKRAPANSAIISSTTAQVSQAAA